MRSSAAFATVLVAVCGLVGTLALPWYGVEPAVLDPGAWPRFVALLERQRTFDAAILGWSAPRSAGPLLVAAAVAAIAGIAVAGTAFGRALLALGSVGALAVCAFALLSAPGGGYEVRAGAWASLACALLLLAGARRASTAA